MNSAKTSKKHAICKFCNKNFQIQKQCKTRCKDCRAQMAKINGISSRYKYLNTIVLSEEQKQIVYGSILGAGHLSGSKYKQTSSYKLEIKHGLKQKEYLLWKAKFLENVLSNIDYPKNRIRLRTNINTDITNISRMFKFKKTVPKNIGDKLNSLGYLIWYLDDGTLTYYRGKYTIRFSTCSFSEEENQYLRNALENNFHIKTNICQWKNPRNIHKPYYGIIIQNEKNYIDFLQTICRVDIPTCMQYKFRALA